MVIRDENTLTKVWDLMLSVRRGDSVESKVIQLNGYNPAVGVTEETVWFNGGIYPYALNTPQKISFASSNAADTAVSIKVCGLDANGYEIEEVVILNGTTAVQTLNNYYRLHRFHTVGIKAFVGDLIAKAGATTIGNAAPSNQTSLLGLFTVPKGYDAYMVSAYSTSGSSREVELSIKMRPQGGVFVTQGKIIAFQNTINIDMQYAKIPELCDFEFRARNTQTGDVEATTAATIMLIKK